jgi:hypothetical protein
MIKRIKIPIVEIRTAKNGKREKLGGGLPRRFLLRRNLAR